MQNVTLVILCTSLVREREETYVGPTNLATRDGVCMCVCEWVGLLDGAKRDTDL